MGVQQVRTGATRVRVTRGDGWSPHSHGVLLALVLLMLATLWSVGAVAAPPAAAGVIDVEALRAQAVAEVGAARDLAGAPPVVADQALMDAAQAHAEYLVLNGGLWGTGFSAHTERTDLPGFTGLQASDRVLVTGFPHSKVMEEVFRGALPYAVAESPWTAEYIIGAWIDAPLHRRGVIDRSVLEIGVGYATDGSYHAYVLVSAQDHLAASHPSGIQTYPVNGQEGVPVTWAGGESPEPFPGLAYPCGYPLTVYPIHGGSTFITTPSATLTRESDGAPVEIVVSPVRNVAFAPIDPLEPGTRYRATFEYTMKNEYTGQVSSGQVTWSFTTAGTSGTTTTRPPTTTTLASTTTTTLPPTTTTTLPPTTTTTTPYPTTTTLPTMSTTVPQAAVFADVDAGHPYREAIEEMASVSYVEGYRAADGTRTFRPDDPVARQQFAKMVARAVQVPVAESDRCLFKDVTPSGAASLYPDNYVAAVAKRGITLGTSIVPPLFSPWDNISRAQVLTMVVRAAKAELPGRLEAPPSGYTGLLRTTDPTHGENIRWAEANGLLAGVDLSSWSVWATCSRAEVAQILWNLVR